MNESDLVLEFAHRFKACELIKEFDANTGIIEMPEDTFEWEMIGPIHDSFRWLLNTDQVKAAIMRAAHRNLGVSLPSSVCIDALFSIRFVDEDETDVILNPTLSWDGKRLTLTLDLQSTTYFDARNAVRHSLASTTPSKLGELFNGNNNRRRRIPAEPSI